MNYKKAWQTAEIVRLLCRLLVISRDVACNAIDDIHVKYWNYENSLKKE